MLRICIWLALAGVLAAQPAPPPGEGEYRVQRAGFLDRSPRRPVILPPDRLQASGVDLFLLPQSVISGRITDEDGGAAPGARVAIVRRVYREGRRTWERMNMNAASEAGEYRFTGSPRGAYLIQAEDARIEPVWRDCRAG